MKMPARLSSKPKPTLKPKLTATAVPAPAPPAPPSGPPAVLPPAPPVCQDSAVYSVLAPFLTHLSAAHLQESPLQQVHDLLNTDQYILIHTALLDSMLAGLVPVLHDLLNGDLNGAVTALLTRTCAPGSAPASVPAAASVIPATAIAPPAVRAAQAPPPPPAPMPMPMPMSMTVMPPAAPSATVDMTGIAFVPAEVTVKVGGGVTWHNSDPVPHTVTSVGSGPLASPTIGANGDYSSTFSKPGTYAYLCQVHPNMRGRVVVQ
jgi:plastocyanin